MYRQGLHIDVLQRQVEWLMGLPAGFKPNPYLNNYLGNFILYTIQLWNHVTARITLIEPYVGNVYPY